MRQSRNHCQQSCHILYVPAPSAAPSLVILSEITNSSITLQWDMVPCLEQNGDITGYRVQYNDSLYIFGDDLGATIIGLTPSTIYYVQVAAMNSAGIGVYSDPIYLVTSGKYCILSLFSQAALHIDYVCCVVCLAFLMVRISFAICNILKVKGG